MCVDSTCHIHSLELWYCDCFNLLLCALVCLFGSFSFSQQTHKPDSLPETWRMCNVLCVCLSMHVYLYVNHNVCGRNGGGWCNVVIVIDVKCLLVDENMAILENHDFLCPTKFASWILPVDVQQQQQLNELNNLKFVYSLIYVRRLQYCCIFQANQKCVLIRKRSSWLLVVQLQTGYRESKC